ncbi:ATP-binding protein [Cecembia rubra]|uniref:ATP-binding protein n=1 Tax=Cecembia rubra TaxID=1485585 RepID=UPI002714E93E|nr:ATP-binding protein [Cecembia rubra]
MKEINLVIDFSKNSNHSELIGQITSLFVLAPESSLDLKLKLGRDHFLYSDYLLLLISSLRYLDTRNIKVNGLIEDFSMDSPQVQYASRVNFFKLLGLNLDEKLPRRDPSGRFTEITFFDKRNIKQVFDSIMKILLVNGVNEDMLTVLNFCLFEVLDNALNHSSEEFKYGVGSGFSCAQFFPKNQEVRIIIADTGQGIYSALTKHPKSKFKNLSEGEAVLRSVDKGVTNSEGMGFGLWATAEMMKKNKGDFIIHSGNYQLNNFELHKVPFWQGTYTFLRINTNVPVNYEEIFGENSDQLDMFQEYKEEFFGGFDKLW